MSFNLELPDGETMKQPGNLFFLTETALYGTNPDLLADVKQDADCDGKVEFGQGIPDANDLRRDAARVQAPGRGAAGRRRGVRADALGRADGDHDHDPDDERVLRGVEELARSSPATEAEEQGFVATSRLSDIADILEGIAFTYDEIEPMIAEEDPQQAKQTAAQLDELLAFVEDLRDREEQGEKFTGEDADTLGSEAQARAEEIAGQVTQAAQRLGIELQDA